MPALRLLVAGLLALLLPQLASAQVLDPTFAPPASIYAPGTVYALGPQQADGKRLVSGVFTRANSTNLSSSLVRFDAAGALDAAFMQNIGVASNIYHIREAVGGQYLLGAEGGDVAAGGIARTEVLRLNANGTADASFDPGTGPGIYIAGDYGYGRDYAAQPDSKVLVTGYFDSFNGVAANGVVRLNANGSVDTGFSTGTGIGISASTYATAEVVAVQADGKVLVGGNFASFNGVAAPSLVRLNANGTRDATFAPAVQGNSIVAGLVVQPDGKILLSGYLYTSSGNVGLVRLNANGSLDTSFSSLLFNNIYLASSFEKSLLLQADGKIVVTGSFTTGGTSQIARLNANGTLDTSFALNPGPGSGVVPFTIGVQADGTVLAGGNFANFNGSEQPLVRLTAAGSLDAAFSPRLLVAGSVSAVVRQPDGQLLVGGNFTEYNGVAVHRLVRVSADGVPNPTFAAATSVMPAAVNSLGLQPDGKVLVGTGGGVARLLATGAPDPTFTLVPLPGITGVAVQADGKVVICGTFVYNSSAGLARFTATGGYDATFVRQTNNNVGTATSTNAMLLQPDGRIVVAGRFTNPGFPAVYRVVRYESTGALDATFNNQSAFSAAGNLSTTPTILALAQQADGKLLVAGNFSQANSSLAYGVARLTATGDIDATFNATNPLLGTVYSMAVQPNGRILLGGSFTLSGGQANLTRVLATGTPDNTFGLTANPNSIVRSVLVQPSGGIVLGGNFSAIGGAAALRLGRLTAPNVLAVAAPAATAARTQAWPVPAHALLHVAPDLSALPLAVELLDRLGRTLRHQPLATTTAEATLSVEGLAAGLYLLRVQYATGTVTRAIAVE